MYGYGVGTCSKHRPFLMIPRCRGNYSSTAGETSGTQCDSIRPALCRFLTPLLILISVFNQMMRPVTVKQCCLSDIFGRGCSLNGQQAASVGSNHRLYLGVFQQPFHRVEPGLHLCPDPHHELQHARQLKTAAAQTVSSAAPGASWQKPIGGNCDAPVWCRTTPGPSEMD